MARKELVSVNAILNQKIVVFILSERKNKNFQELMNYFKSIIFAVLTISVIAIFSGCSGTSPEYSQYRSDLKYQMQDMINVLNAGHNSEFMEKFVDPTYVQKMGGLNKALIPFSADRARALQSALRVAKNVEPTYEPGGKQMSYFSDNLIVPIVFKQKNGKWYLQDDWLKQ